MIHNLKIVPQYLEAVFKGDKSFELRKDDRDYKVGDYLRLQGFEKDRYTGYQTIRKIIYILKDCEEYGLQPGFVILGLSKF